MAYKQTKWKTVYDELKKRIIDGTYPQGSEFQTNKEIGEEFNLHTVSVQTAVSELIREGLVIPSANRATRRTVRRIPTISKRKGGFSDEIDSSEKPRKELVELNIIDNPAELPEEVAKEMKAPILFYHHNQFKGDILVANSQSYIPSETFPLRELERRLKVEERMEVKQTIIVNGHGGNVLLGNIAQEMNVDKPRILVLPNRKHWDKAYEKAGLSTNLSEDMHAGEGETSLLMYLYENGIVRSDKLTDVASTDRSLFQVLGMKPFSETGSIGFATRANKEKGKLLLHHLVDQMEMTAKQFINLEK